LSDQRLFLQGLDSMCGIAGSISKVGIQPSVVDMERMLSKIHHRGPDGSGVFVFNDVGLAHRRLSIIDLTQDAHQPMVFANGQLVITFNGEIYNYLELKADLLQKGHVFKTKSDTEVILAAYAEWGEQCVSRFNGMWAFALFDKKQNILFCSRDRFGVKPFYYTDQTKGFYFGSEIRQLLPFVDRVAANNDLVVDFLLTSMSDHTDDTYFVGIKKLPAGCNLIYQLSDHRHQIRSYYELKRQPTLRTLSLADALEVYRAGLQDAIALRLRSDVPVGTCLSGGLDSSSIATLASPLYKTASGDAFRAITAISEQESNNEAGYAQQVVEHSGLNWLPIKPTYQDFLDTLPQVVRAQEEPFGSTSLTMQYLVMREARCQGIPVLLDGQGGDETLLGYNKYYGSYLLSALRSDGLAGFMKAIRAAGSNNSKMSIPSAMYFMLGGLVAPARYLVYLSRSRYLSNFPTYPNHLTDYARASFDDFDLQKLEMTRTNLPVLLRYEDKNSMAHSIETRLPFLDYRLVEIALSLPNDFKIHNGWSKWLLRKAMDDKMPDTVTWRKSKLGFEAPEKIWMEKHIAEMKEAVCSSDLLRGITVSSRLRNGFESLNARTQWRLYSTALWEKEFGVTS
jgi:asparagine synthase (glutamine-hydrolysing)